MHLCEEHDSEVERFRHLGEEYPYITRNATFLKVRQGKCVVPKAVVIAIGVMVTASSNKKEGEVMP